MQSGVSPQTRFGPERTGKRPVHEIFGVLLVIIRFASKNARFAYNSILGTGESPRLGDVATVIGVAFSSARHRIITAHEYKEARNMGFRCWGFM